MAKIGTAHIEIKPVLNEEALENISTRIEEAVRVGLLAGGLHLAHSQPADGVMREHDLGDEDCWCEPEAITIEPACDEHKEVQHRDGKSPWCNSCGWRHGIPATPPQMFGPAREVRTNGEFGVSTTTYRSKSE